MNADEFLTYRAFSDIEEAHSFAQLLNDNNIPYQFFDGNTSFDPSFSRSTLNYDFRIKLLASDFAKVDKLLESIYAKELACIDPEYFLFQFSDAELLDVVKKKDEWGQLNFLLACKLLKERGLSVEPQQVAAFEKQRLSTLALPEKMNGSYIFWGYLFSILGGLIGIIMGWFLLNQKKTLPNGNIVYMYAETDRIHGNRMVVIGFVLMVIGWSILLYTLIR